MTFLALEKETVKGNSVAFPFCNENSGLLSLKTNPSDQGDGECLILFKVFDLKKVGGDKDELYIQDIYSYGPVNEGYGSAAMRALIRYSISKKYGKIRGLISPDDHDHIPRLHHFYKKHGFQLPEGKCGETFLDLSNPAYILSQIDNQLLVEENAFIKNHYVALSNEFKKLEQELERLELEKENEPIPVKFLNRIIHKTKLNIK
ncbi:hypothetical protein P4594_04650 [Priestia megaterium]|uniref:hypothetical protein n=1 Tax=Priestia megaterium TaxID=1404 RepID=UPI002E1F7D20|nr:hypothetical protein [Priestia megaterium]